MNYRTRYANGGYRPTSGYRVGPYGDGASGGPAPPPGNLSVFYDGMSVDGAGNAGAGNGASLSTLRNLGYRGSSWDCTLTSATKPTLKVPSAAGKMNGAPSILFDGTQYMQTALQTAIASANFLMACSFKMTNITGLYALFDGHTGGRSGLATAATTGVLTMTGTSAPATNLSVPAGQYSTAVCTFNGASSIVTLDGVASTAVNPTNQALTGITLGSIVPPPTFLAPFELLWFAVCEDGSCTAAQFLSFATGRYGATPQ